MMGIVPVPLDEGLAASIFGDARRPVGPTGQLLLARAVILWLLCPIIVIPALAVVAAK
jgi:hypothetical protein